MKLGFTTLMTPGLTIHEIIAAAVRYGYDSVSIRIHAVAGELQIESSKADMIEVRNAFSDNGILPGAVYAYNESGETSQMVYQKTLDYTLRVMETAAVIGAENIRLFVEHRHKKSFCEALEKALEKSGTGVGILLQNHEPKGAVAPYIELIKEIGRKEIGLAFSPDHCGTETVYEQCVEAIPYMREVYVTDKKRISPAMWVHTRPGDGDYDWEQIYHVLNLKEFHGITVIKGEKLWHPELDDYTIALPYAKKWFMDMGEFKK